MVAKALRHFLNISGDIPFAFVHNFYGHIGDYAAFIIKSSVRFPQ